MTLRALLVVVLVLGLVPVAAQAGTDEARNVSMGASGLVPDSKQGGTPRSHTDVKPQKSMGRLWDPNKAKGGRGLSPQEMRDLYSGLNELLRALGDQDRTARERAWASIPGVLRDTLADMGIDRSNWEYTVSLVNILPRRIDGVLARDWTKGEGATSYVTRNVPQQETYIDQEEVRGPIGCGCRGSQVIGYRDVERTRTVYVPRQFPVDKVVPVIKTSAILTPFDGVKTYTVPRQVQEPYTVSIEETAPIGCGCRGSVVVGYREETRYRSVTVYDNVSQAYTTFEPHLAQNFKALGNRQWDNNANLFLKEGSYNPNDANSVKLKLDDNGNPLMPPADAKEMAAELARNGKTGEGFGDDAAKDPNFGRPIERQK